MGRRVARPTRRTDTCHTQGGGRTPHRVDGLCRQCGGPLGTSCQGRHPGGPGQRPDFAPQPLGRRILPRGTDPRGVETDDGRPARSLQGEGARIAPPTGGRHQPTHRPGHVFLRLWQRLPPGVEPGRCRHLIARRQLPLPLLRTRHHGTALLRLRFRSVPLGVHLLRPRRPRPHRPVGSRGTGGNQEDGDRRHPRTTRRQHPLDTRGREKPPRGRLRHASSMPTRRDAPP